VPKPRVDRGGTPVSVGVVAPESPYMVDAIAKADARRDTLSA